MQPGSFADKEATPSQDHSGGQTRWERGRPGRFVSRPAPSTRSNSDPNYATVTFRALLVVCLTLSLSLVTAARVAHADPLDDETRRIAKQLQCPVCAGAAVADSPSDLAGQMRSVIRAKLESGESEEQIIAYFVERYGDSVLIEPPRRGIGLAVWLAPIGVLIAGAVLLWRVLKLWLRPRPSQSLGAAGSAGVDHPPTTPYRNGTSHVDEPSPVTAVDRARAELDRFRAKG
ncbi:MAG TPA: cytochrome c-type biogenesis protein CcmH [Chloroflexota bacterium]|nr:cytochrome c-type biogenesis protein CcmH [Chloroflexota bacterium]